MTTDGMQVVRTISVNIIDVCCSRFTNLVERNKIIFHIKWVFTCRNKHLSILDPLGHLLGSHAKASDVAGIQNAIQ